MISFSLLRRSSHRLIRRCLAALLPRSAAVLVLGIILCGLSAGCGDDDGGFKPALEILPASSPENVLNNLAVCYMRRDSGQLALLLDDDFVFRFTEYDILRHPGSVPQEGVWSKSDELEVTGYMFDRYGAPADSLPSITEIEMVLKSSGTSAQCNLIGAPPGTIEMTAHLSFTVRQRTPKEDLVVASLPLFYFVPSGPDSARTWKLWMVEDDMPKPGRQVFAAPGDGHTTVPVLQASWGWVKALYWSYKREH